MSWSPIITRTNSERTVSQSLQKKGLSSASFYFKRVSVVRGRRSERLRSALPGYLFVEEVGDEWRRVLNTPQVRGFISNGEQPAVVEDINLLKVSTPLGGGLFLLEETPTPSRFSSGDRIQVLGTGMLSGHYGKFISQEDDLATISIEAMGRYIEVTVLERDLIRVKPRRRKRGRRN